MIYQVNAYPISGYDTSQIVMGIYNKKSQAVVMAKQVERKGGYYVEIQKIEADRTSLV